ncbi:hypothetical protein [Aurantimonas coralicida]|uniref:hypothetical protein n=1 Tax=Aurantimonas coralicida TaxID=182270 RepID=UPI001D185816|nr:hypothetical protein [Aurantimonas coralicida]MCC4298402.1 hypothetical protein [Aurantimonas coralicida]
MTLYADLKKAKSEEDVKDIYIKALGLKSYTKGLIDIQTKEVWFEAKIKGSWTLYEMFTQLLYYVQVAINRGDTVPPILAVVDTEKAAIMRSADIVPFLRKKTVKWGKSASIVPQAAIDEVSAQIGTKFVAFRIETDGFQFVTAIKEAIRTGKIVRTQITPDNLKQVFDEWVLAIGQEIDGVDEDQYNLLFFADVMHDGSISTHKGLPAQLLFRSKEPVFQLDGKLYELNSTAGYERFWQVYDRPPQASYRNYLLERRDSLIPIDDRMFRGAFYTPLHVVDRAYDFLKLNLGKNWQKRYKVWDMCCGVGNLEVKHGNHRNLFMSTLDQSDVDVMKSTKTCPAAHRFQYDYLNDDIADDGTIDYSLTGKVPSDLRDAIEKGERILVLINPPYAEGMNAGTGVADTRVGRLIGGDVGYARRELFVQFLLRIQREIPNAVVAMFSKLKYVNAPNFGGFREEWTAKYLGGFVVPSRTFDGLTGNFPIGFLIWDTGKKRKGPLEIQAEVLDRKGLSIGAKRFYDMPGSRLLNTWIKRTKPNGTPALPLTNALQPTARVGDVRGTQWADGAIGGMICKGSDLQNAGVTALFSSGYASAGGILVTENNLRNSAMVFTVRRLVRQTWLNDRDQFLIPNNPIPPEFAGDCLIWMLFNNRNLSVGADGLRWNGKDWSLVNHFIPFTETEVGAFDRFESDFMSTHLATLKLSKEATAVMDEGRKLWGEYFAGHRKDDLATRNRLKLGRPDVGWFQIREALKARAERGLPVQTRMADVEKAYAALSAKIDPDIYALGFLKA